MTNNNFCFYSINNLLSNERPLMGTIPYDYVFPTFCLILQQCKNHEELYTATMPFL